MCVCVVSLTEEILTHQLLIAFMCVQGGWVGLFFHHYDKCKHGFVTHLIIKVLEMSCKLDRWMVDVTIRDVLGVKYDERGWNVIML